MGQVDWLFSDMICYPARLLALVRQWMAQGSMRRALQSMAVLDSAERIYGILRTLAEQ